MKVGFIGLGRMGQAMARRLLEAKHDVGVYNRTPEKIKDIVAERREVAEFDRARLPLRRRRYSPCSQTTPPWRRCSEQNGGLLQSLPKGGIHICSGTHGVAIIQKTQGGAYGTRARFSSPHRCWAGQKWWRPARRLW